MLSVQPWVWWYMLSFLVFFLPPTGLSGNVHSADIVAMSQVFADFWYIFQRQACPSFFPHLSLQLTCLVLPRDHCHLLETNSIWQSDTSLDKCSLVERILQLDPLEVRTDGVLLYHISFCFWQLNLFFSVLLSSSWISSGGSHYLMLLYLERFLEDNLSDRYRIFSRKVTLLCLCKPCWSDSCAYIYCLLTVITVTTTKSLLPTFYRLLLRRQKLLIFSRSSTVYTPIFFSLEILTVCT